VTDAQERQRFEAFLDGKLTGFAEYIRRDGVIVLVHTEVDPESEGHGIGSALARAALDDAAARGEQVRAPCPFISDWIGRHPAYQHLLAAATPGGEKSS
jgi:uncharacterized protein